MKTYTRNPQATSAALDGETVLMSVVSNRYFSLNTLGSTIWNSLEQPRSLDEIVQSICEYYAVEESVARGDVTEFLDTLQSRKLVQLK